MSIIPDEWVRFLNEGPYSPLEIAPHVLWDTLRYKGGGFVTEQDSFYNLEFFQVIPRRKREGNMRFPGVLLAPCSFLVQEIQIKGVTRLLSKNAMVLFQIGQKMYFEAPLELFVRHHKLFPVRPPLMIGPLINFKVSLEWLGPRYNGGDQPKIEIRLIGQIARPVQ